MNLTLQEESNVAKRDVIIVNGEKVGWAEISPPTEYRDYVQIHVGFNIQTGGIGLIQGHGKTLEEAVTNAIARGRDEATQQLMAISRLEKSLTGE